LTFKDEAIRKVGAAQQRAQLGEEYASFRKTAATGVGVKLTRSEGRVAETEDI